MSRTGLPHDVVVYPCSDGQPMAETEVHGACMVYVAQALRRLFETRGRADVYVGSNNFLYYERGNPRAVVSPDVYVVVGARAGLRDTYLLWNEPKGPDFVLEVTSASTRRDDERRKREVYAALGVSEYFLYDPRAEYLAPALQGFRLREGEYRALPAVTVLPGPGWRWRARCWALSFATSAGADAAPARPRDRPRHVPPRRRIGRKLRHRQVQLGCGAEGRSTRQECPTLAGRGRRWRNQASVNTPCPGRRMGSAGANSCAPI